MGELSRVAALVAATLAVGLMAGVFFAFTVAVMPGLARADDRTFVVTMQRINVAIVNGWFLLAFLGALVLPALAAALHLGRDARSVLPWAIAGFVLYAVTMIVTVRLNIPLNNQLDSAGDPDSIADLAAVRERFEATWVRWNLVRTLTSTAALGCLAWGLVVHGRLPT
jgi:uncharacterized membrane protein